MSNSSSRSASPIRYPTIEKESTEANVPSVTVAASPEVSVEGQLAATDVEGLAADGVVTRLRTALPERNGALDQYHFPPELCIDWNILNGAPVSSFAMAAAAASNAYYTRGCARGDEDGRSSVGSAAFSAVQTEVDPALLSLLATDSEHATSYMKFLPAVQEQFFECLVELNEMYSEPYETRKCLTFLGITCMLSGVLVAFGVFCDGACGYSTITVAIVVMAVGALILFGTVVLHLRAKKAYVKAVNSFLPLRMCGGVSRTATAERREWHVEVRFEGRLQDMATIALFTISWRRCTDECILRRPVRQQEVAGGRSNANPNE